MSKSLWPDYKSEPEAVPTLEQLLERIVALEVQRDELTSRLHSLGESMSSLARLLPDD